MNDETFMNQNLKILIEKMTTVQSPIQDIPDLPYPPKATDDFHLNVLVHTEYVTNLKTHYKTLQKMTNVTSQLLEYTKTLPADKKSDYLIKAEKWLYKVRQQLYLTETTIPKVETQRNIEEAKLKKAKLQAKMRNYTPQSQHSQTHITPRRKFRNNKNQQKNPNTTCLSPHVSSHENQIHTSIERDPFSNNK